MEDLCLACRTERRTCKAEYRTSKAIRQLVQHLRVLADGDALLVQELPHLLDLHDKLFEHPESAGG